MIFVIELVRGHRCAYYRVARAYRAHFKSRIYDCNLPNRHIENSFTHPLAGEVHIQLLGLIGMFNENRNCTKKYCHGD